MHGIVLKRLGIHVTILEQYLTADREGQAAGIVTLEYSHKYLTTYDRLQSNAYAVPVSGVQNIDKHLQIKSEVNRPMRMSSWNVLYNRLRANLDGLRNVYNSELPHELPNAGTAVYSQGKRVTDVKCVNGKMVVHYEDLSGPSQAAATIQADLVIAADGSTSLVRRLLQPSLEHTYSGYVAWRGTVLEADVSGPSKELFKSKTTLCAVDHSYIAVYIIPGENGTLEPGKRLINYVWYTNLSQHELPRVMTDTEGREHRQTLPIGKMRSDVWERQQAAAQQALPAPFAELVSKTTQPFISAIVDIPVCKPTMHDGKVMFVGDALCAFRPHVASSGNQAALNALLLAKLMRKEIDLQTWEAQVVDFAHRTRLRSITWGGWYQFGTFSFLLSQARFLLAEYVAKARGYWTESVMV